MGAPERALHELRPQARAGIYAIVNQMNGHLYIGSSKQLLQRWAEHLKALRGQRGNTYLQRAFNKYGEAAFEFCIVEAVGDLTSLHLREQIWIDALHPAYNLTTKARGGNWTPEAIAKLRATMIARGIGIGRRHSEATKRKIGDLSRGHETSPATRAKIRAALLGRPKSEEHRRKAALTWLGRKHTDESRRRISEAQIGRTASEETKARMATSMRAYWERVHSGEAIRECA